MGSATEGAVRRGHPVELDRERRLRFNMAAVSEIQDRFGVDLVAGEDFAASELDDLVWLVWLGLKHAGERPPDVPWWTRLMVTLGLTEPPEIPQELVYEWVDMENLIDVSNALNVAMGAQVDADRLREVAGADDPTRTREGSPEREEESRSA